MGEWNFNRTYKSTASNNEQHYFAASQGWKHIPNVGPTTSSLAKQRVSTNCVINDRKSTFWGRRPDRVAINEALKIGYILKFKRSTDRDKGFVEVKDAEANEQHKSIIGVLKAAAPEWEFEQINFVVGNRGSVVDSDFYTKLKKLDIQEAKKTSSSPIM